MHVFTVHGVYCARAKDFSLFFFFPLLLLASTLLTRATVGTHYTGGNKQFLDSGLTRAKGKGKNSNSYFPSVPVRVRLAFAYV